ncbi:MAG: dipeptidase, partial [Peptococcaceae bacterium]|nr:dipeptidase [Peptococcaceae bacterium]
VVGLCFCPDFVNKKEPSLEAWLDHAEHVACLVGVDYIGIGSDFDGMDTSLPGLADVAGLPVLTGGLLRRGFSGAEVQKILGGNFLRVLQRVLPG